MRQPVERLERLVHGSRRLKILPFAFVLALAACKSKDTPATAETKAEGLAANARKLEVPRDTIYVASSHVRVVDAALGQVVAGIDLAHAIKSIEFDRTGDRAFLAASDGVHVVDVATHKLTQQLTHNPARHVFFSPDGKKLHVLENAIKISEDQKTRTPEPFHLLTFDASSLVLEKDERVGERVFRAYPSFAPDRLHMLVSESGRIKVARPPEPFGSGTDIDPLQGPPGAMGVRHFLTLNDDGTHAYVPVEGEPSRILDVDLVTGNARAISLGEKVELRGLAIAPGNKLLVDGSNVMVVVDLSKGETVGKVPLEGHHTGIAASADGRRAYLARTLDGSGGSITVVELDRLRVQGKILINDITPWVIAARPRAAMASR